jgi:adenylosuccinate synthase
MSKAIAVIGANFGDEGKGLATDFFSRHYKASIVARGNGGAQAGHTVVDGHKRHVFGHVGSGSFAGVPTYLSSAFIVNPFMLNKECRELKTRQRIYASPDCRVTTFYDMAINSLIEIKRGQERHGSCGMGINETVTRDAAGFHLDLNTVKNNPTSTLEMLSTIRDVWVPERMLELNISKRDFGDDTDAKMYFDLLDTSIEHMAEELMHHSELIQLHNPKLFLCPEDLVVVEGAQGLMLDEFLGDFPHVTRSVTGLASSIRAAAECGKTSIRPVYMSRAYATRHGAGELLYQGAPITDAVIPIDQTNVDNNWQGSIRYAPLNLNEMAWYIREDMKRGKYVSQLYGVEVLEPKLFITCLDQLGEHVHIVTRNKEIVKMKTVKLISYIEKVMGIEVCATSYGPSADDVQLLHEV